MVGAPDPHGPHGPHCPGCGRPRGEGGCPGCSSALDPHRFCAACGHRLTVQVTPTGWRGRCRACGQAVTEASGR